MDFRNLIGQLILVVACLLVPLSFSLHLQRARQLKAPDASVSLNGEQEGALFWEENAMLLQSAWIEWEKEQNLPRIHADDLLDETLRNAVNSAWLNHTKEEEVADLWYLVPPGVYRCQLFQPEKIPLLRAHIDAASKVSGIPYRRPNGMNRYGMILHPSNATDGAVNLQAVDEFLGNLLGRFVRPVARLLFAGYIGKEDDHESYSFTIRYKSGEDLSLSEHADASVVTLNVNLNSPAEKGYQGSSLFFLDDRNKRHYITFEPGMALLHLGQTRHAAMPIEDGERTNLVMWMFGKHGYVRIAPRERHERLSPQQRWTDLETQIDKEIELISQLIPDDRFDIPDL